MEVVDYVMRCSGCQNLAPVETFHSNGRFCARCHEEKQQIRRRRRTFQREVNRAAGMFRTAKNRSKREGIEFSITLEDIIIPKNCPVLGVTLTTKLGIGREAVAASPSLDRKDSARGYVPGNVWVISWRANFLKSNATLAELKKIVRAMEKMEREARAIPWQTMSGRQ